MIEIEIKESVKANNLYNEIKNVILSKKDNKSFEYNMKEYFSLPIDEKIYSPFYHEYGTVEFKNINDNIIKLMIGRYHNHSHNGYHGLCCDPCLKAVIYEVKNEEEIVLWELNVTSATLTYKAKVTSLEIPFDILQEKKLSSDINIKDNETEEITEDNEVQNTITKPQKTINLFNEVKNLYNKYKTAEQQEEKLLLKRKKEMEEACEKIIKSYSQKLEKNNENIICTKKELNDFEELFTKYATFNINSVGNAIQQLISLVESEEYCYSQVTHNFKNRIHGVMDSWDESVQTKAKIIVKKDIAMECYDSSYRDKSKINELVKNGYALLLSEQSINRSNNENISFYTSKDGQVVCHVDFGRFDYIEKFINNMVQYRFQNKLLDFTEKDILLFMKDFIIKHKNIIIKNHTSKIKEKLLNFEIK